MGILPVDLKGYGIFACLLSGIWDTGTRSPHPPPHLPSKHKPYKPYINKEIPIKGHNLGTLISCGFGL